MSQTPPPDPFPPSEFDQWAGQYDDDVTSDQFPFTGYRRVMADVVRLAEAQPGQSVLDLGTGTGNLAQKFAALGCELWCTDFSTEMLEIAREKLHPAIPAAHFILHDLRQPFPTVLARRFDRIVSAYVFHHLELTEKIATVRRLIDQQLNPGGYLVIADISFPTRPALGAMRQSAGDQWDEEPYWIVADALPALKEIDPSADYVQVSDCAGIYRLRKAGA